MEKGGALRQKLKIVSLIGFGETMLKSNKSTFVMLSSVEPSNDTNELFIELYAK